MIDYCLSCPVRLFNSKHYNLQGVGTATIGRCIVIPNVDYNAYKLGNIEFGSQVQIVKSIFNLSTGGVELTDFCYIVPLLRCNKTIACEIDNTIYNRCMNYFKQDVIKYQFTDILLLGDAGRVFFNCNIKDYVDYVIVSPNRRRYVLGYRPLTKYADDKLFEEFQRQLIKWYNATANNDFSNYKFLKL